MNYKGYRQLRKPDRLRIEGALRTGASVATIAAELGFCKKTIYNEIKRGLCVQQTSEYEFVEVYCADVAEAKYQDHLRAKGPDLKIGHDFAFAEYVEDMIINKGFSPGSVLAQIRAEGRQYDTQICETTLYNYIYRGVFLNVTKDHLLYKGERRKEPEETQTWASAPKGATIEERPREVWSRQTFGHWEMDSLMGGTGTEAALLVLTERYSRLGIVIRVPDHTAESVVAALDYLERRMGRMTFRRIFRTITVDNGSEFADYDGMERSYRCLKRRRTRIFYCHPYSPNERGSNENMNRILRRFFPKGISFDDVTQAEVTRAMEWMNNYPRKILGWKSANAIFQSCIAAA